MLTEKEIKRELRKHLKRKLKIGNGHCQMSIRRLAKMAHKRKANGHFIDNDRVQQRQDIHKMACKLCEEYGGVFWGTAWKRSVSDVAPSVRVYQF